MPTDPALGLYDDHFLYNQARDQDSRILAQDILDAENRFRRQGIKETSDKLIRLRLGNYYIWSRPYLGHSLINGYAQMFKFRYEYVPQDFITSSDQVILDIGANEGFWTLRVKEITPHAQIIAVEPNPIALDLLERNLGENHLEYVTVIKKGLGLTSGWADFEMVKEVTSMGAFKIIKGDRAWLTPDRIETIKVEVITLDKLVEDQGLTKIDVIKIDTEGSEVDILRSGQNTINMTSKFEIEYHTEALKTEVEEIMKEKRFQLLAHQFQRPGDGVLFFARV
jgi:FkbM family methyltransferase